MEVKRPFKLVSYGSYLPKNKVTASQTDAVLNLPEGTVEIKSKIKYRFHASVEETNSYMGAHAIKSALEKSKLSLNDLDLIISASGSKEQPLPYGGALIHEKLCALYKLLTKLLVKT